MSSVMPGIVRESFEGQYDMWKRLVQDYGQCVKEKEIATASCKTWEETVDHLIQDCIEFGRTEALLDVDDAARGLKGKTRAAKRFAAYKKGKDNGTG